MTRRTSRAQKFARLRCRLRLGVESIAVVDAFRVDERDQKLAHHLELLCLRQQDFVGHLNRLERALRVLVLRLQRRELPVFEIKVRRLLLSYSERPDERAERRCRKLPGASGGVHRRRRHSREIGVELLNGVAAGVTDTAALVHRSRKRVQERLIRLPRAGAAARRVLLQELSGQALLLNLLALARVHLRIVDDYGTTARSAELRVSRRHANQPERCSDRPQKIS
jgi:hypothetical protein